MIKVEIETEVSKLGTTHKYEKMGQGDDLEGLSQDELIEEIKQLDQERVKRDN